MSIGEIKLGRQTQATSNARANPDAFGAGISRAASNLAGALGGAAEDRLQIETALGNRRDKTEEFNTERAWLKHSSEQNRNYTDLLRGYEAGAAGVTNDVEARIRQSNDGFMATVPESLKDKYLTKGEALAQAQVTGAFDHEYAEGNNLFRADISDTLDEQAASMVAGGIGYDEASATLNEIIELSDLPALEKREVSQRANQKLLSIEYQNDVKRGRELGLPIREATGEDVVVSGLAPHERGILNGIAKPESNGSYNVRYGGVGSEGKTFDDFSDHPRIYEKRADGRVSSAAGRYQFTAETWDQVAEELGLKDFSPANQDLAAIHLARQRFNGQLGAGERTFDQLLTSGQRSDAIAVKRALVATWEGFGGMSDDEFVNIVFGAQGIQGGGTGTPLAPDIWSDEKYATLSFEQKSSLFSSAVTTLSNDVVQVVKQQKAAQQQGLNEAYSAALNGKLGMDAIEQLKREGIITTAAEEKAFRGNVDEGIKITQQGQGVMQKLLDPSQPFTQKDNVGLNKFIGEEGLASLNSKDPEFVQSFVPLVQRTGFIPSDPAKVLKSMAQGSDISKVAYAQSILGGLYSVDPSILERSNLGAGLMNSVAEYHALSPYMTPEEIRERQKFMADPKFAAQHEVLAKEGRKLFADVSTADIEDMLDPGALTAQGKAPSTPSQSYLIRAESESLYAEGYSLTQDEDAAQEYMVKKLGQKWSYTDIGGERRLTRDAPKKYYPTVETEYTWIDQQARTELGLGEDAVYELVPDDQTAFEGDRFSRTGAGNNASYQVSVRQEDGTYKLLLGEDGSPERIAFDENDPTLQADIAARVSYTNTTAKHNKSLDALAILHMNRAPQIDIDHATAEVNRYGTALEALRGEASSKVGKDAALVTMEEQAQHLFSLYAGSENIRDEETRAYYDKLIADIDALGGANPEGTN